MLTFHFIPPTYARWCACAGIVGLLGFGAIATTSTPEKPVPTLTEQQKLTILNAAKDLEIARLKLQAVLVSVQREGFDLDLNTLTYVPKSTAPK